MIMNELSVNLQKLNQHLNKVAQKNTFSSARYELLRLIKQHNPITLRQLAEIQQVSMPTLSKIVDDLQNESLVIKALSKEDARQRWIVPTQKGLQTLLKVQQMRQDYWQSQLQSLNLKQQGEVAKSLELLVDCLNQESSDKLS
jgi:DNA-binding MarR family transcriptional regulator